MSVVIIAEAGVNHNGDVNLAKRLIDVAADARTDAVKFQTFRAEQVVSRYAPKAEYQTRATDPAESQFEMIWLTQNFALCFCSSSFAILLQFPHIYRNECLQIMYRRRFNRIRMHITEI